METRDELIASRDYWRARAEHHRRHCNQVAIVLAIVAGWMLLIDGLLPCLVRFLK